MPQYQLEVVNVKYLIFDLNDYICLFIIDTNMIQMLLNNFSNTNHHYLDIKTVLRQELGNDWKSNLKEFNPKPVAAASIGQVHRAVLNDGRVVAIKVQVLTNFKFRFYISSHKCNDICSINIKKYY